MAKIMVIAGGEWQCPIVQTAKSMGHTVICSIYMRIHRHLYMQM